MCKERIWKKCKRFTSGLIAGMILSIVFTIFIVGAMLGAIFNYLGDVMLPSRKEKGGA